MTRHRDDLRRLHQADRIAHGTAWEPISPWAAFRALGRLEQLAVVAGGIVGAMALFGLPWALWFIYVAITGQMA